MCLPLWKILTALIWEEVYSSQAMDCFSEWMEHEEHIIYCTLISLPSRRAKRGRKDIALAWTDNKQAYNMVLQNWIIDRLKVYKISDKVVKFITEAMKNRKVELIAGGKILAVEKIQKSILLGDTVSRLMFVIVMLPFKLRKCTDARNVLNHRKRLINYGRHQVVYKKGKIIWKFKQ